MVYLVSGHINLNRSGIYQGDFVRYLHLLGKQYRLSSHGDVQGMDAYGFIAKQVRDKHIVATKCPQMLETGSVHAIYTLRCLQIILA